MHIPSPAYTFFLIKGGDLGLRDAIGTFGSHGQSDEQPLFELNLFALSVRTPMV